MSVTSEPTTERLTNDELRTLFLFESLDDEQLSWLAERSWVSAVPTGAVAFEEGDHAELIMVLLSGTIALSRRVGPDDVETVRTDQARCVRRRHAELPQRCDPDLQRDGAGDQ